MSKTNQERPSGREAVDYVLVVVKSILQRYITARQSSWLVEREVCLLLNGRQDHAPQSSPNLFRQGIKLLRFLHAGSMPGDVTPTPMSRKFGNRISRAYSKLMSYQCHRATVTQAKFGLAGQWNAWRNPPIRSTDASIRITFAGC